MTTRPLLEAHHSLAELIVANGLQVQHVSYHPRTVGLTTITVDLPSWPDAFLPWCDVLTVTHVRVKRTREDTQLTVEHRDDRIEWRVTTTLPRDGTRDRLPGVAIRWDTHRSQRSRHRSTVGGWVPLDDLRLAFDALGITPAHVAG